MLLVVAAAALALLALIARPLFFATVDPDVAAARGVPVRLLGAVFLVLLGCAAAEVSQITGALLVFALLVMPAATAQQLTSRPMASFWLTIAARPADRVARASPSPTTPSIRSGSSSPASASPATCSPRRPGSGLTRTGRGRVARGGGVNGLAGLLGQPFLRYAFIAGAAIAAASGLTGYFVVLRSQVFTGDALSHVAFTGALAALAAGADLLVGLYGACVLVALAMAVLGYRGPRRRHRHRQRVRLDPRPRRALPVDLHDLDRGSRRHVGRQRAVRHHLRALGQPGPDRLRSSPRASARCSS